MEKESPCEFVSAEYIICECGDNFPSEEKLKIHLVKDHGQKIERTREKQKPKSPEKKVVVLQQPQEYFNISIRPVSTISKHPRPLSIVSKQPRPVSIVSTQPRPVSIVSTQPRPVAIVSKQPRPVSTVSKQPTVTPTKKEQNVTTQDHTTPKLFIFAGNGKPKPIKITKPLYILQAEDIKQEVFFEALPEQDYTLEIQPTTIKEENEAASSFDSKGDQLVSEIVYKEEIEESHNENEESQMILTYHDEESNPDQQTEENASEETAIITYTAEEEKDDENYEQDGEIYEEQEQGDGQEVEFHEIQYEEIQYDEEVTQEAGEYETVMAGHWLREHNYLGETPTHEFFCDVCGKSFPYEKSVNLHKRVHKLKTWSEPDTAEKKKKCFRNVVCDVCGKKYASPAQLRYHQRVHTGEKPYSCQYCPKKFTMPLFLQSHLRTHTGEKPYPCSSCPKAFSNYFLLQIHVRTHTGERPYQCPLCPKAFTNRAALLRHERVHTGAKPYPCPECGKCFSQSNSMKLHVRTVHMKLPAPYKSKARKLRELKRKEALLLRGARRNDKTVFDEDNEECLMYDGDEKVVISLGALDGILKNK